MWNSANNIGKFPDSFYPLLEKDSPTKGSFITDYECICETYSILKCPYVSSLIGRNGTEIVRVCNAVMDLITWRSVLLSICTVGSKVTEVDIHSCSLQPAQLEELAKTLIKCGNIKLLKLQYLDLGLTESNAQAFSNVFKQLFQEGTQLEYLSLKGNKLKDDVLHSGLSSLNENYQICCINLADNELTDKSLITVSQAVRYLGNIKLISFARNKVEGSGLTNLLSLTVGSLSAPADEAAIKALAKVVADKNKAIKDTNKKRKKAGMNEFVEIGSLPDLIRNVDSKTWISNRSIETVDLSNNPVINIDQVFDVLLALPTSLTTDSRTKFVISNSEILDKLSQYQNIFN